MPKLAMGISGFDHVSMGGLPARRTTVVAGQAGSAKTVFAGQFLAERVRRGVFVTLEEPAADLRANLKTSASTSLRGRRPATGGSSTPRR